MKKHLTSTHLFQQHCLRAGGICYTLTEVEGMGVVPPESSAGRKEDRECLLAPTDMQAGLLEMGQGTTAVLMVEGRQDELVRLAPALLHAHPAITVSQIMERTLWHNLNSVKSQNATTVTTFILLGFTEKPELGPFFSSIFVLLYIFTVLGNGWIVTLIRAEQHLHTPMYFFISNLSLLDLCYSSVIAPKALEVQLQRGMATISLPACATQKFCFTTLVTAECFLLAAMAYDRFLAISHPLTYTLLMTQGHCLQLVLGAYSCGLLGSMIQTSGTFRLSYCGPNRINHFFCDIPAVLKLSCSDTHLSEAILFASTSIIAVVTTAIIFISYMRVLWSVLRGHASEGRRKALSTCTSHFTTLSLFYGTAIFMYAQPRTKGSQDQDKVVSMFYTLVIPMLNPLIYSLRNKDVKEAMKRLMSRKIRGLAVK
ncbi:olfactory receptor 5B21-like [Sphaerodactylus townsendi]|uniref:olfactory receptor 5B21-like n=1 Tax=Sphaerodactylus townsendi TaxID=933632 RepID=UPI002026F831|nr:olfactory receptor 5B21-like [Sphaerodactylus townsendi]